MPKTPGIGERVAQRLEVLGYWKNDRPDVGRFCEDHGVIPSYLYRWLDGETPRGWRLLKLAKDLDVAADWLVPAPSRPRRATRRALASVAVALALWGLHEPAYAEPTEVDITNARYRKRRYRGWWTAVKLTTRGWSGFDPTPIGGFPRIDRIVAVA